ncbi:MAG: inositol monophosphatase family protein [Solirubrobacteraceae bacterium]
MSREDPNALLAVAREAATVAGALLRDRFEAGSERRVASKTTPTDPVSEADLASQRAIHALIAERRPADAFLGEEEGADEAGSSGLRWIVDPLDGTVNFLYGIAQWSVSVAVADEEGALAGVVHDPMSGETFEAIRGGPATRNGVALASRADHAPPLAQALVATGFAYDARVRAEQGEVIARLLPRVRDIRRLGSAALDLCGTAAGRFDAYFERDVKPWDTTAGALVCVCAGLEVRSIDGGILAAVPTLAAQLELLISEQSRR